MTVRILIGDVRERLRTLPDAYFDMVCTSPPYWGLRDYGVAGQIGLERTLGEHLAVMVEVFREVRRVLKPQGTLWLNYGDCYAASPNGRAAADVVGDDRTFRDKPFSTVGPIFDPAYARTLRVGTSNNRNGCTSEDRRRAGSRSRRGLR
ncbi:DNA modification methylase M.SthI [Methylorubrum populi]|uniref:site-specific DNA-methyltransferase (adenine-specific) n=1 Tax=Methylorubrum populi TaxID=223967 RepID=A0A833J0Q0_9HYPH|nr:DNA modification methylase M.SthI [Methylorubrum populi]